MIKTLRGLPCGDCSFQRATRKWLSAIRDVQQGGPTLTTQAVSFGEVKPFGTRIVCFLVAPFAPWGFEGEVAAVEGTAIVRPPPPCGGCIFCACRFLSLPVAVAHEAEWPEGIEPISDDVNEFLVLLV